MFTSEDIDKVDWAALGFPQLAIWLEKMQGDDESLCTDALYAIGHVIIKTDLFRGYGSLDEVLDTDVHWFLLPYLLKFLQSDFHLNKRLVLSYLSDMAGYITFDSDPETLKKAQRLHDSICQEAETFFPFIKDEDYYIRLQAINILRRCSHDPARLLSSLLAQLRRETEHENKLLLLDVIGDQHLQWVLPKTITAKCITVLEDLLSKYTHPMIRLHTALNLLKILKHDVPAKITQIILENLVGPFNDPDMYILGPTLDFLHTARTLGVSIGIPLLLDYIKLSTDDLAMWRAMLALLDIAFEENKYETLFVSPTSNFNAYLGPLLSHLHVDTELIIFDRNILDPEAILSNTPLEEPTTIPTLNQVQKYVIGQLVDIERTWQITSNLFYIYGLSGSREKLRSLIK